MNIEVVLTQDDPKLGKRGQIVKVSPGYAQNFLFPHKKAVLAAPGVLKRFEEEKARKIKEEAALLEKAKALAEKVSGMTLFIEVQTGHAPGKDKEEAEEEKLYGSVTSHEILSALEKRGVTLDKKNIHLEEPIKKLGAYRIPVKLHPDAETVLKLHVVKKK